ncbi:MAG: hypothetical protein P4N59_17375 [Negativicutes bacterium]|nr:hypothetical protein [Negativicutes bacterium]
MKKRFITGLLILCLLSAGVAPVAQAFGFGDILKVGGVAILISKFATPLNNFINTLTAKHGATTEYATKVVPILTVGTGGYIGAAQVIGPEELVAKTEAVIAIEADFNGNQFRVHALLPIDSKNPINFSRVNGVGISATIDIKI